VNCRRIMGRYRRRYRGKAPYMISQIAVEDLLNRTTIRASQVIESQ
jgi:hypothetical protein